MTVYRKQRQTSGCLSWTERNSEEAWLVCMPNIQTNCFTICHIHFFLTRKISVFICLIDSATLVEINQIFLLKPILFSLVHSYHSFLYYWKGFVPNLFVKLERNQLAYTIILSSRCIYLCSLVLLLRPHVMQFILFGKLLGESRAPVDAIQRRMVISLRSSSFNQ